MTSNGDDEERDPSELRPKKKRRAASVEDTTRREDEPLRETGGRSWSSGQLLAALAVGLAAGGFGGYAARGAKMERAATATAAAPVETVQGPRVDPSAAPAAAAAGADKFGRPAGDEHFGHDHPTQQGAPPAAPAPAPGPDGKDSFGRAAGHEHFGHNHP